MSIPMQLLLVVAAFCLCLSEGAPDGRVARAKQQRPTRGFKNLEMMTARGFGKRARVSTRAEPMRFHPKSSMMVASGFGKRNSDEAEEVYGLDNFWETLAAPEREGQEMEDDKLESIPLDWFGDEIVNNPDFARSVVRKFVDINQDGVLSSDELLRNV